MPAVNFTNGFYTIPNTSTKTAARPLTYSPIYPGFKQTNDFFSTQTYETNPYNSKDFGMVNNIGIQLSKIAANTALNGLDDNISANIDPALTDGEKTQITQEFKNAIAS